MNALASLKRSGVNIFATALFRLSKNSPSLSYITQCLCTHATEKGKEGLKRHQNRCTRLMFYDEEVYDTVTPYPKTG